MIPGSGITGEIHLDVFQIEALAILLGNPIDFAVLILVDDDQLEVLVGLKQQGFQKIQQFQVPAERSQYQ
jgi:hypothetical protein